MDRLPPGQLHAGRSHRDGHTGHVGTGGSLLCELHAHTTFSDGELTLREVVDLYGDHGFDVLCVTDHCVRADDPWLENDPRHVHAGNFARYLHSVEQEAARGDRSTTCWSCPASS
jgi:PHP domain